MSPDMRRAVYDNMIKTLCSIHKVDVDKAGLSDYGKKGNVIIRKLKVVPQFFFNITAY